MDYEHETFDISDNLDLIRLIDAIRRDGSSVVLRRDDQDVAVLTPLATNKPKQQHKAISQADQAAFIRAGGSWQDEDTETLIRYIYAGRRSSRSPVDV